MESDESAHLHARDRLLYLTQLSYKYHSKREHFFALADRIDKVATLSLGTVAFTKITSEGVQNNLGWMFGIIAIIALVFNFSDRARKHNDLATEFKLLESKIEEQGVLDLSDESLNKWNAERIRIEIGEPPVLCALVRICQNEMAASKGLVSDIFPLKWHQRLFAYFWPFSESLS